MGISGFGQWARLNNEITEKNKTITSANLSTNSVTFVTLKEVVSGSGKFSLSFNYSASSASTFTFFIKLTIDSVVILDDVDIAQISGASGVGYGAGGLNFSKIRYNSNYKVEIRTSSSSSTLKATLLDIAD